MAVAYSTLANAYMHEGRGTVVRPHLGVEIDDSKGGLVQELISQPAGHVDLNYSDLSLVMEGIHDAASEPGGTSYEVWQGWNQAQHPVYGKTGTAQHTGKEDQSWYMCYIADPQGGHPIVIAVTVEQGGFGAETAAPIARLIAAALDVVGLLAIEMFVDARGRVLANEIAPRPHNSGHWSIDACPASQFEMHIRAIAGLPLPAATRHADAVMRNLVGPEDLALWPAILATPGLIPHLYGKAEARPRRKMGHVTRLFPKGGLPGEFGIAAALGPLAR